MVKLSGFGVCNLRALKETGIIGIKPITVLVGKNSAGKSSFARILPLLKQSAERKKQAPLLWFGRMVDFGSFDEALSSFAAEREIELNLEFSCDEAIFLARRPTYLRGAESQLASKINVSMTLGSEGDDSRTVLKKIQIDLFGVEIVILTESLKAAQILVGGTAVSLPSDTRLIISQGSIIPQIRLTAREQPVAVSDSALFRPKGRPQLGVRELRSAISLFVHGNTLPERKDEIGDRLPIASLTALLEICKALPGAPDTWRANMSQIGQSSLLRLRELQRALIVNKLEALLQELDQAIQLLCEGVSYLEPLRATAQRYYRREELSIEEIDPKGLNTTFFIQGLTAREKDSLNRWLSNTVGFTLSVKTAGGHSSLNIETDHGDGSRNMADVGLGYSQLAPVAIQLWAATQRLEKHERLMRSRSSAILYGRNRSTRSIVVVEQPELHLHPAYQAKLADVFAMCTNRIQAEEVVETVTDHRNGVEIIAETHSPNLINRLGELIGEKKLLAEDVQVLVFEEDPDEPRATKIRVATFDDEGVLRNWPIGFFDY